jgi:hypothetical protein
MIALKQIAINGILIERCAPVHKFPDFAGVFRIGLPQANFWPDFRLFGVCRLKTHYSKIVVQVGVDV